MKFIKVPAKDVQRLPYDVPVDLVDYAIANTEVTYDQWHAQRMWAQGKGYVFVHLGAEGNDGVVGASPSQNAQEPVTQVSVADALVWLNALSEREGRQPVYRLANGHVLKNANEHGNTTIIGAYDGYRLPTGTEWDVASTWLGTTPENTGTIATERLGSVNGGKTYYWAPYNYASGATEPTEKGALSVAWLPSNAKGKTQPVALKKPNKLGLYDMSGNVKEWVTWDARTFGVESRGESYATSFNCSFRTCKPNESNKDTGFRPVCSLFTEMTDAKLILKRPFADEVAQKTVDASTYSGKITWKPALVNGTFAPDTVYTATVTIQPKNAYRIRTVRANRFRMYEAGRITHATKSSTITIVFLRTEPMRTQFISLPLNTFRFIPLGKDNEKTPVNLSPIVLGQSEVTYGEWEAVVRWAMNNGYTFAHKGREGAKGDEGLAPTARRYEPVTDMGLQDVLVWLNAYSQKAGFDPVYRQPSGATLKDATKNEPIDRVAISRYNGFRLPTSVEYAVAGRYLGTKKPAFVSPADELITTKAGNTTHYWTTYNGLQNSMVDNYSRYPKDRHFTAIPLFAMIRGTRYDRSDSGHTIPVTWDVPNALGFYGLTSYPNAQERVMNLDHDKEFVLDEFQHKTHAVYTPEETKQRTIGFRIAQTRVQNIQQVPIAVPRPVANGKAATSIESSYYTATVRWEPAVKDGRFAPDTAYTANVSLTLKPPFRLENIKADMLRVPDAQQTRQVTRNGEIRAIFPATAKRMATKLVRVPASQVRQVPGNAPVSDQKIVVGKRADYYIGNTEVTYSQWYEVLQWAKTNGFVFRSLKNDVRTQESYEGTEGSQGSEGALPTERRYEPVIVPWLQAIIWLNAYSKKSGLQPVYYNKKGELIDSPHKIEPNMPRTGQVVARLTNGYRFPTHQEWTMAAQWLGTTMPTQGSLAKEALRTKEGASTYYWTPSRYASGATASLDNTAATQRVAWYDKNGGKQTKDVGQKQPNALGLYDMSGNIAEYVFLDPPFDPVVGAPYTITAVGGDVFDGDALGVEGAWCTALDGCRPALTGFRVARSL